MRNRLRQRNWGYTELYLVKAFDLNSYDFAITASYIFCINYFYKCETESLIK